MNVDVTLVIGTPGEYTVWVDDKRVVEKTAKKFPDFADIVAAVRAALAAPLS